MVVVTGGTGHLGNVLVKELIENGETVRLLLYPGENPASIAGLVVETISGDIRDVKTLKLAFQGADTVYHLAGMVSILPQQRRLLEEINVQGTKNVVEACIAAGVKRLVYTSSVHALADMPKGFIINESVPFSPLKAAGEYGKSKARATIAVLEGVKRGLNAVVVCPSGVVGPFDYGPSRMGRLVMWALKRKLAGLPDGGYNFVDVRDIAKGQILAARNGQNGEAYILSGDEISFQELMKIVENATGRHIGMFRIPMWVCRIAAFAGGIRYRITRKDPLLTAESLEIIRGNYRMSSEKAESQIGWSHRPVAATIGDTITWFTARATAGS